MYILSVTGLVITGQWHAKGIMYIVPSCRNNAFFFKYFELMYYYCYLACSAKQAIIERRNYRKG